MNKICLSVLIGIPGAGKTSFCNNFQRYLEGKDSSVKLIHICYDSFIKLENANDMDKGLFKSKRQLLLRFLESLVEAIQKNDPFLMNQLSEALKEEYGLDLPLQLEPTSGTQVYVLLLDDNMYYRSMRYEIFKLARKHCTGYQQIYFEVPLLDARVRNSQRTKPVPDGIVSQMWMKLEKPSPRFYTWEKNTTTLRGSSANYDAIVSELLRRSNEYESVADIPVPMKMEQSNIHKMDLLLRKTVGEILRNNQLILFSAELKLLSNELIIRKQKILNDLKAGLIKINPDEITDEGMHSLF
ncbi:L-seryl-tRNA(Sec) kinase [Toxorhynchites rutilus septentrionalis]|uniref:L-seryl-tRNA(Sec) kinase n=1 Tax=Toxorhynchites rutilus septentrionalis TaxID=329112 RepID=UPI00247AE785|nr:L-seryl-tRNA(Sec) kinase [Toxorhynchites rutilus septentrionalis]